MVNLSNQLTHESDPFAVAVKQTHYDRFGANVPRPSDHAHRYLEHLIAIGTKTINLKASYIVCNVERPFDHLRKVDVGTPYSDKRIMPRQVAQSDRHHLRRRRLKRSEKYAFCEPIPYVSTVALLGHLARLKYTK
ncbi:hypothetical protein M514_16973 [Trichuris suis]|uniref:Uncharacterized protein n=1 Tax=Trichuris suis TaxID=68888 RepID=A0A085NN05_9BILA|nr:hypothetical protein M514_16973 [Trichuris suis]